MKYAKKFLLISLLLVLLSFSAYAACTVDSDTGEFDSSCTDADKAKLKVNDASNPTAADVRTYCKPGLCSPNKILTALSGEATLSGGDVAIVRDALHRDPSLAATNPGITQRYLSSVGGGGATALSGKDVDIAESYLSKIGNNGQAALKGDDIEVLQSLLRVDNVVLGGDSGAIRFKEGDSASGTVGQYILTNEDLAEGGAPQTLAIKPESLAGRTVEAGKDGSICIKGGGTNSCFGGSREGTIEALTAADSDAIQGFVVNDVPIQGFPETVQLSPLEIPAADPTYIETIMAIDGVTYTGTENIESLVLQDGGTVDIKTKGTVQVSRFTEQSYQEILLGEGATGSLTYTPNDVSFRGSSGEGNINLEVFDLTSGQGLEVTGLEATEGTFTITPNGFSVEDANVERVRLNELRLRDGVTEIPAEHRQRGYTVNTYGPNNIAIFDQPVAPGAEPGSAPETAEFRIAFDSERPVIGGAEDATGFGLTMQGTGGFSLEETSQNVFRGLTNTRVEFSTEPSLVEFLPDAATTSLGIRSATIPQGVSVSSEVGVRRGEHLTIECSQANNCQIGFGIVSPQGDSETDPSSLSLMNGLKTGEVVVIGSRDAYSYTLVDASGTGDAILNPQPMVSFMGLEIVVDGDGEESFSRPFGPGNPHTLYGDGTLSEYTEKRIAEGEDFFRIDPDEETSFFFSDGAEYYFFNGEESLRSSLYADIEALSQDDMPFDDSVDRIVTQNSDGEPVAEGPVRLSVSELTTLIEAVNEEVDSGKAIDGTPLTGQALSERRLTLGRYQAMLTMLDVDDGEAQLDVPALFVHSPTLSEGSPTRVTSLEFDESGIEVQSSVSGVGAYTFRRDFEGSEDAETIKEIQEFIEGRTEDITSVPGAVLDIIEPDAVNPDEAAAAEAERRRLETRANLYNGIYPEGKAQKEVAIKHGNSLLGKTGDALAEAAEDNPRLNAIYEYATGDGDEVPAVIANDYYGRNYQINTMMAQLVADDKTDEARRLYDLYDERMDARSVAYAQELLEVEEPPRGLAGSKIWYVPQGRIPDPTEAVEAGLEYMTRIAAGEDVEVPEVISALSKPDSLEVTEEVAYRLKLQGKTEVAEVLIATILEETGGGSPQYIDLLIENKVRGGVGSGTLTPLETGEGEEVDRIINTILGRRGDGTPDPSADVPTPEQVLRWAEYVMQANDHSGMAVAMIGSARDKGILTEEQYEEYKAQLEAEDRTPLTELQYTDESGNLVDASTGEPIQITNIDTAVTSVIEAAAGRWAGSRQSEEAKRIQDLFDSDRAAAISELKDNPELTYQGVVKPSPSGRPNEIQICGPTGVCKFVEVDPETFAEVQRLHDESRFDLDFEEEVPAPSAGPPHPSSGGEYLGSAKPFSFPSSGRIASTELDRYMDQLRSAPPATSSLIDSAVGDASAEIIMLSGNRESGTEIVDGQEVPSNDCDVCMKVDARIIQTHGRDALERVQHLDYDEARERFGLIGYDPPTILIRRNGKWHATRGYNP